MFIIKKNTKAGLQFTGIECETLDEAKAECSVQTVGKTPTADEADNYFRLEVYEVAENGDQNQVYVTDFFEE